MKKVLLFFTMAMFWTFSMAGQDKKPAYDAELAKKLGADDNGMKMYVLVILKTGKHDIQDKAVRDSLFSGHFDNINRMADEGKLIIAGPMEKNANSYRGLFILNVTTFEEAGELLKADPTIKEGIFDVEMFKWYGSAAIPVYLDTHKRIEKSRIK